MTPAWDADHPRCPGCPHGLYTHAHQRYRTPGPKDHGRPTVDPWLTPAFRAAHPGLGRAALALTWLREEFSGA